MIKKNKLKMYLKENNMINYSYFGINGTINNSSLTQLELIIVQQIFFVIDGELYNYYKDPEYDINNTFFDIILNKYNINETRKNIIYDYIVNKYSENEWKITKVVKPDMLSMRFSKKD